MPSLLSSNTPSSTARADLDGYHSLTTEQREFFEANGYVKLKQVLRPATLEFFAQEITEQVERLNAQDLPMAQRTNYQKAFLQVMNLWTHGEVVREFSFSKKLARLAAELLAVRGVRMYHDQALYKEAGGGITPWHADQHYWPFASDRAVTVWVPLQATPLEMGPLTFARGTHRMPFGHEFNISDESEVLIQRSLEEAQADIDETPFDLGEVSFHLGWTFHRTGANRSSRARKAMTMIYIDEQMQLIEPKTEAHQNERQAWCPGVAVGDVIASPLNPMLWHAGSEMTEAAAAR